MKLYGETAEALKIRAPYEDFNGGDQEWQLAFYQLWRYQLTFEFAYNIKVWEYSDNTLEVVMIIHPVYKESVLGLMQDLGYRNVKTEDCKALEISPYDGDMEKQYDIEAAVIKW